jgi:hypothetical protein
VAGERSGVPKVRVSKLGGWALLNVLFFNDDTLEVGGVANEVIKARPR